MHNLDQEDNVNLANDLYKSIPSTDSSYDADSSNTYHERSEKSERREAMTETVVELSHALAHLVVLGVSSGLIAVLAPAFGFREEYQKKLQFESFPDEIKEELKASADALKMIYAIIGAGMALACTVRIDYLLHSGAFTATSMGVAGILPPLALACIAVSALVAAGRVYLLRNHIHVLNEKKLSQYNSPDVKKQIEESLTLCQKELNTQYKKLGFTTVLLALVTAAVVFSNPFTGLAALGLIIGYAAYTKYESYREKKIEERDIAKNLSIKTEPDNANRHTNAVSLKDDYANTATRARSKSVDDILVSSDRPPAQRSKSSDDAPRPSFSP